MSDQEKLKRIFEIWREGERLDSAMLAAPEHCLTVENCRKLKAMQVAIDEITDSIEDPAVTTVLLNFIREAKPLRNALISQAEGT